MALRAMPQRGRDHQVSFAYEQGIAKGMAQPVKRCAYGGLAQTNAFADACRARLAKHRVENAKQVQVERLPIHHANIGYSDYPLD